MISLDLQGRRALVTGESGGLGRAIAETLAAAGAQVAVHYRKGLDEAEAVVAAIQKQGGKAQAFQADVADPAAVEKLLQEIEAAFGGLDILVNNAGMDGPRASVGNDDPQVWEKVLAVDLISPVTWPVTLPALPSRWMVGC